MGNSNNKKRDKKKRVKSSKPSTYNIEKGDGKVVDSSNQFSMGWSDASLARNMRNFSESNENQNVNQQQQHGQNYNQSKYSNVDSMQDSQNQSMMEQKIGKFGNEENEEEKGKPIRPSRVMVGTIQEKGNFRLTNAGKKDNGQLGQKYPGMVNVDDSGTYDDGKGKFSPPPLYDDNNLLFGNNNQFEDSVQTEQILENLEDESMTNNKMFTPKFPVALENFEFGQVKPEVLDNDTADNNDAITYDQETYQHKTKKKTSLAAKFGMEIAPTSVLNEFGSAIKQKKSSNVNEKRSTIPKKDKLRSFAEQNHEDLNEIQKSEHLLHPSKFKHNLNKKLQEQNHNKRSTASEQGNKARVTLHTFYLKDDNTGQNNGIPKFAEEEVQRSEHLLHASDFKHMQEQITENQQKLEKKVSQVVPNLDPAVVQESFYSFFQFYAPYVKAENINDIIEVYYANGLDYTDELLENRYGKSFTQHLKETNRSSLIEVNEHKKGKKFGQEIAPSAVLQEFENMKLKSKQQRNVPKGQKKRTTNMKKPTRVKSAVSHDMNQDTEVTRRKEIGRATDIGQNKACDHYVLDLNSATFGMCVCGFHKTDHAQYKS